MGHKYLEQQMREYLTGLRCSTSSFCLHRADADTSISSAVHDQKYREATVDSQSKPRCMRVRIVGG
jgi:hypothetical protein